MHKNLHLAKFSRYVVLGSLPDPKRGGGEGECMSLVAVPPLLHIIDIPHSGNFYQFSRITNKHARKKFRDFYFRDKVTQLAMAGIVQS